jgi:DNA (cytosine-5)-methyltransferase 1
MRDDVADAKHRQADAPAALAVDMFCGAGGTTRGFIDSGILVFAGIDNDSACAATYTHPGNNTNPWSASEPAYIQKDVARQRDEILNSIRQLRGIHAAKFPGRPLILAMSAPCQPFTGLTKIKLTEETAKKRLEDAELLAHANAYVDQLKPDAIFCENVPGIARESAFGDVFARFRAGLEPDYRVGWAVVNAKFFGVPQNRRRSILLAVRRGEHDDHSPLKIPNHDPRAPRLVTVRDVLGSAASPAFPRLRAGESSRDDPNHVASPLAEINLLRIRLAQPGKSNVLLGDLRVRAHRLADRSGKNGHHSDVYGRMSPRSVASAITTKCYSFSNGRYGYPYKNQDRAISLREAAVLQTFPNDYMFFPTEHITVVGKQIGNAVPPKMAAFFGSYLLGLLQNSRGGGQDH